MKKHIFSALVAAAICVPTSTQATVLATELLAYFNFDGQADDQAGNGAPDAALVGPAAFGAGFLGQSLDLGAAQNSAGALVAAGSHFDAAFNADTMAVSFWQFNNGFSNSSAFWFNSPGATANSRGFQAHTPWSNGTVFFDTAGCCTVPTQRFTTTGAVTGAWQHFVFKKNPDGTKDIWIDGVAVSQAGASSLLAFDGILTIGGEFNGADPTSPNNSFDGRIDEFAVWSTMLSDDDIMALANGAPTLSIVVPEPSAGILALFAGALLLRRRR